MYIHELYRAYRLNKRIKAIRSYTQLNSASYYGLGFCVDLRNPVKDRIYLTTGKHCVLDGKYIFETESGNVEIGDRVHIGCSTIISINQIIIEDDVTIAWDCLIYDHNSHSIDWRERRSDTEKEYECIQNGLPSITNKDWTVVKSAPIRICKKAWVGTGATILKGVTIGEGAIVGAGSVVTKDVEPWTVVGGNPAKLLKRIQSYDE